MVPPDWVNHNEPRVLAVLLLICPSTFNDPPDTFNSGFPAEAYSISLFDPLPFPIFTTPEFITSKRPCKSKSPALLLAAPMLIVPILADKHPEDGMVNALVVVRVMVSGVDSRNVPFVSVKAVAKAVFNEKALTVASRIEFRFVPLFTVKILKSVLMAVVPLIPLLPVPVKFTLQI